MQGIIMAAGRGSRIHHLTNGLPKSFLEIGGKKLIERNVDMLRNNGIEDIIIVTGYRKDAFENLFAGQKGIRLVFNPFYEQANVIGSYWTGMNYLKEDFVYLHADTICENALFEDLLKTDGDIVLPVEAGAVDDEAMKVRLDSRKRVVEITKNMPVEQAAGEFIGIAKIKQNVINLLNQKTTELMVEKAFSEYFEAAIQRVLEAGKFDTVILPTCGKFWAEVDFEEDYRRAEKLIKD